MTTEWIKAVIKWQKENPGKDWLATLFKLGKKPPPLPKKGEKNKFPPLPPKPPKI